MMIEGDSNCRLCKLHQFTEEVCEMGFGPNNADIMVVSRMPNSSTYQDMIEAELSAAGIDLGRVYFTSVMKCRVFDVNPGKKDLKICPETYLQVEIDAIKPKFILGFGNEALAALTKHSGIMKWRGRVETIDGVEILTTVSPASVIRNPGQKGAWQADLQLFASTVNGHTAGIDIPKIHRINTKEKLKKLKQLLLKTETLSYDIETAGLDEWDPTGGIVSLAGTSVLMNGNVCLWVVPLDHPQSPFRSSWKQVLKYLASALENIPKQIAHNGKFDAKWLIEYGVKMRVTFDTMLAAHLLDENRMKGLKPLARMLLGVAPWGIDTKDLRNTELADIEIYNALDTYYTYRIYLLLRAELIETPRTLRLFKLLTIPANAILIEVERKGAWIDREKLESAYKISFDMRDSLEAQLMEFVPDPETEGWPRMGKKEKLAEINFNASNWMRWFMFEYLNFPVIERGKQKDDGSLGDPSLAELTMVTLREMFEDHPVLKTLEERSKWEKYCTTYVSRYREVADDNDRVHTTFKLAGTVTGRLSSGKEDDEKITARRDRGRGVNLQQVPRDPFIRGLFGSPPGSTFVEADFGQIEFRLAVFISRDRTGLWLIRNGIDVHLAMAAKMTGKAESQVTKEERKAAKPVNFGYLYGMWWTKFMQTAKLNYGIIFTEEQAKESRRAFFEMYPAFLSWHARQRRIVHNYGRVISPLGRIRHLPDVYSADKKVQQEAERQAINSPVQSMASDMNVLSMILIHQQFKELGIRGHTLGLVHDAINFEIDNRDLAVAIPIIKQTMENLPLKRKFGVDIDIPIASDIKVGRHWGNARELTPEQADNFGDYYDRFITDDSF